MGVRDRRALLSFDAQLLPLGFQLGQLGLDRRDLGSESLRLRQGVEVLLGRCVGLLTKSSDGRIGRGGRLRASRATVLGMLLIGLLVLFALRRTTNQVGTRNESVMSAA